MYEKSSKFIGLRNEILEHEEMWVEAVNPPEQESHKCNHHRWRLLRPTNEKAFRNIKTQYENWNFNNCQFKRAVAKSTSEIEDWELEPSWEQKWTIAHSDWNKGGFGDAHDEHSAWKADHVCERWRRDGARELPKEEVIKDGKRQNALEDERHLLPERLEEDDKSKEGRITTEGVDKQLLCQLDQKPNPDTKQSEKRL